MRLNPPSPPPPQYSPGLDPSQPALFLPALRLLPFASPSSLFAAVLLTHNDLACRFHAEVEVPQCPCFEYRHHGSWQHSFTLQCIDSCASAKLDHAKYAEVAPFHAQHHQHVASCPHAEVPVHEADLP